MKYICKSDVCEPCLRQSLFPLTGTERPLFMDIETTGLSAERNHLYLVGCCYPEGDRMMFRQWFSEGPQDEGEVLSAFFSFVEDFEVLVHFNGDTFDLPYLVTRAEKLGIDCPLPQMRSLDIFREVRCCKGLLALPNMKLKTLETYLGFHREDTMSGGELIEVYRSYVKSPDPDALHLLLIHNEEDILNMPRILPILTYPQLVRGEFAVADILSLDSSSDTMELLLRMDTQLPSPLLLSTGEIKGLWKKNVLHLTLPLLVGERKYFFPNYRDYYYLPAEDTAMHKSVAEFVDRDFRVKAKKETAYIRKCSCWLTVPDVPKSKGKAKFMAEELLNFSEDLKLFCREYKGGACVDVSDELLQSADYWSCYVRRVILNCI